MALRCGFKCRQSRECVDPRIDGLSYMSLLLSLRGRRCAANANCNTYTCSVNSFEGINCTRKFTLLIMSNPDPGNLARHLFDAACLEIDAEIKGYSS